MALKPLRVEKIVTLCLQCYQNLGKAGKPSNSEWTSLSCLILEEHGKIEVICSSTGTKCLPGDHQKNKHILTDSHSEVLCKRAFKRYLIERINSNYFLENYRLHLFVSQLPCGVIERYQGQRRKAPDSWIQRKPGKGKPCFEASCVDKIAKWNLLGLQGKKLIGFLKKPIKIHSIIVGNCSLEFEFNYNLLTSCLLVDQENNDHFLIPDIYFCPSFKLNPFIRKPNLKACPTAIVYWQGLDSKNNVEIVANGRKQGTTKKNALIHLLKISRQLLFEDIQNMIQSSTTFDSHLQENYIKVWDYLKNNHRRFKGWKNLLQT